MPIKKSRIQAAKTKYGQMKLEDLESQFKTNQRLIESTETPKKVEASLRDENEGISQLMDDLESGRDDL